jgi:quercetin dioxygenase-like cupin family protein
MQQDSLMPVVQQERPQRLRPGTKSELLEQEASRAFSMAAQRGACCYAAKHGFTLVHVINTNLMMASTSGQSNIASQLASAKQMAGAKGAKLDQPETGSGRKLVRFRESGMAHAGVRHASLQYTRSPGFRSFYSIWGSRRPAPHPHRARLWTMLQHRTLVQGERIGLRMWEGEKDSAIDQQSGDEFYRQLHESVCFVISGRLLLLLENDQRLELVPGDSFTVPKGLPHMYKILEGPVKVLEATAAPPKS